MTDMNGSFWLIIGCVVHNLHRTTYTHTYMYIHKEYLYSATNQFLGCSPNPDPGDFGPKSCFLASYYVNPSFVSKLKSSDWTVAMHPSCQFWSYKNCFSSTSRTQVVHKIWSRQLQ